METEPSFIQDIRQMLRQARQQAYSAVNSAMIEADWNIGRRIVEEGQKASAPKRPTFTLTWSSTTTRFTEALYGRCPHSAASRHSST